MARFKFHTQWEDEAPAWRLETTLPSMTVPDQSMTIAEIIAKYTRHGLVPSSIGKADQGGNVALEPDFDPMDEWNDSMVAAARAEALEAAASAEPAVPAESQPAPEGGSE